MARLVVPMSVRRLIVEMDPATVNVTEFCAMHGISTRSFWRWRQRYLSEGAAGLEERSRAPKRVANKTPAVIEDAIVTKRKELTDAGLDAGPASIHWHLEGLVGLPSESTIWRILTARGFIVAEPAKAPKRSGRRFEAERANECWALDDTTWTLAGGQEVKVLNVIDDHSRLLVASVAMSSCTGSAALAAIADAASVLGWPARFLSDNASAFRHVLADALAPLGIDSSHTRPYHPQTNGKVERFHQTLKRRLAAQPAAGDLAELQDHLDAFRHLYNHHRPHRALHRAHPADIWTAAPKAGPAPHPLGTPSRISTSRVHGGYVWAGRKARITIGAAHNGNEALIITTGTNCHIFINGRLVRALTLNPNKTNHPLHHRPGRPTPT